MSLVRTWTTQRHGLTRPWRRWLRLCTCLTVCTSFHSPCNDTWPPTCLAVIPSVAKTFTLAISWRLCRQELEVVIILTEFYSFISVLATVIEFQDHSSSGKTKLKVQFSLAVVFQLKNFTYICTHTLAHTHTHIHTHIHTHTHTHLISWCDGGVFRQQWGIYSTPATWPAGWAA